MVRVTMYSPSEIASNDAFGLVEKCVSIHDGKLVNHVGAEYVAEISTSHVDSFVAWLEGYGFHRR